MAMATMRMREEPGVLNLVDDFMQLVGRDEPGIEVVTRSTDDEHGNVRIYLCCTSPYPIRRLSERWQRRARKGAPVDVQRVGGSRGRAIIVTLDVPRWKGMGDRYS